MFGVVCVFILADGLMVWVGLLLGFFVSYLFLFCLFAGVGCRLLHALIVAFAE